MGYPVYYPEANDTLPHLFDSFDGGTGASITMTGLAVTDIEIYKGGSATTRSSDNGYVLLDTDGIDFDSTTGIHGFSIDLSDDTDSGFYAVGSWYHVVIKSITVDAQTVNFVAFAFRIVSLTRGLAGTALPDAAADAAGGLVISDAGAKDFDAMHTAIGTNGTNLTEAGGTGDHLTAINLPNQTMDITGDITGNLSGSVGSLTGHTVQTGDSFAVIGTLGAGLTDIPWNSSWDAEVQSEVNDALVALGLDHLVSVAVVGADVTDNSIIAKLASKEATADWDSFVNTDDSLEALSGAVLTPTQIAIRVWDTSQSSHTTPGTFGELAIEIGSILEDTETTLDGRLRSTFSSKQAISGTVSTITLANAETFADDIINDHLIQIVGGTGAGQARLIDDWTLATKVADITPNWTETPDSTSKYEIIAAGVDVLHIEGSDATDVIRDSTVDDGVKYSGADVTAIKTALEFAPVHALATNTALGGTSTTIQLAASETFADDEINGNVIQITGGTGKGQSREISDWVLSTTTATVSAAWTTTPDSSSKYQVVHRGT